MQAWNESHEQSSNALPLMPRSVGDRRHRGMITAGAPSPEEHDEKRRKRSRVNSALNLLGSEWLFHPFAKFENSVQRAFGPFHALEQDYTMRHTRAFPENSAIARLLPVGRAVRRVCSGRRNSPSSTPGCRAIKRVGWGCKPKPQIFLNSFRINGSFSVNHRRPY